MVKKQLFELLYPRIQYCITSCGCAVKTVSDPLIKLEKRTVRVMAFSHNTASSIPLFHKLRVLTPNQGSGTYGSRARCCSLMTASGSLDIFVTVFVIFLQSHQQHHEAPQLAFTVRSIDICHCLKLLILLKNTHVSCIQCWKISYGSHGTTIKNM